VSKGRKQSRDTRESSEIFSDADFDADEFVEQMNSKEEREVDFRPGWRRLEALREEQMLRRALSDFDDWDDSGQTGR
jgi:hypothetical protein